MGEETRKTGIDIIGDVPWGTHCCLFYEVKQDLLDILVPFFQAGLENNESCVWITSEPFSEKEAKAAMRKDIPDFAQYLERGQINFVSYTDFYFKDGVLTLQRVEDVLGESINQAQAKGYDGMRVTGNTAWVEEKDWRKFTYYEEEINKVISKYNVLSICTYSLDKCGASEIIDVVNNHQFALIRQEDKWEFIESPERRRAEEQAVKLLETIEIAKGSIYITSADGEIIYTNDSMDKLFGYKKGELVGKYVPILNAGPTAEAVAQNIMGAIEKEGYWEGEIDNKRKDGTEFISFARIGTHRDKDGKILNFLSTQHDITERKQAEEALRESEERYRALVELGGNVGEAIVMLQDKDGREAIHIFVSNEWPRITGYSRKELLGMSFFDLVHPKHQEASLERHKRKIRGESIPGLFEMSIIRKDGVEVPIELTSAYTTYQGERATVAFIRDITERKQMEKALRESEENFRNSIENAPFGIMIMDALGEIGYGNQAYLDIWGYSSLEVLKAIPRKVRYVPQSCAEVEERLKKRQLGESVADDFQVSIVRKDGEIRYSEASTSEVLWDGKKRFQVIYRDITERKKAEEKLRESEERYRALVELGGSVGEAIIMLQDTEKGNGIQTFISNEWPRITGYSKKQLLGMSFFDLVHPKHRQAALERRRRKRGGESIPGLFEMSIIRKDGVEVPIEITSAHTTYQGNRANVAFIRDITERKQAEEREKNLQQELSLSSRLASIGELAAGVAHEINNPLTGIIGFSERLLRKSADEGITRDLERIHSEAQRAVKVVENLQTFARQREPRKEYSDINETLARTLELRAYELRTSNIELVVKLSPDIPKVMVDFQQIQQVFLNIILNAEQAMTEASGQARHKLVIKTQQVKGFVRILFTDTGPGIPAEHLSKLFDPFFTTRGEEGGTGLGLSVCHGIVAEHGGKIYAQSKPGKGAVFFVELPLATEEIGESKAAEEEPVS